MVSSRRRELSRQLPRRCFFLFGMQKTQETLRMDLWVKDMPVDQMQRFFHQSLVTMGETYFRATQDEKMAQGFEDFAAFFAEKLNIK